ncbi:Transcription-repair-coupling factor,transcription-repair coupling factor,Superfamily II DNA/RNA helicase required for DNA uptake (late competence protein),transcription-repair coupling factor,TRCF domain [Chlamydia poikilotherma]|uniref:Transcription-repair-coupling factor n=1 Tax=Chlamydia poikilotherma TaxID=1967783 RepID=A0A3B0Q1C2_9CHLA|nr:transcription-repair coupling factor [Chlamydia poikilotherma]SYX09335.1 Transcription-repair-coupling factor,transcription-repair coupling factor,Superfamily II DNA/RNA helicase required for DNA uptake (late competence protein),transcription-repair coupling factor,TRCF domain [Chlamydia poikilotherma]
MAMDFDPVNLNLPLLSEITNASIPLLIENIRPGARGFLTAKFFREREESVVMITTRSRIDDLFEDLSSFLGFPPVEFPSSEIDLSPKLVNIDAVGKRDKTLYELYEKKAPLFCVTTLKALLEKTRSPKDTAHQHLDIQVGDMLDPEMMMDLCKNLGYRHETLASDKGEFAYRGGIIDIFPLSSQEPFRIEFWGEKIISIRPFNPSDQLSTGKVSKLSISPATKDSGKEVLSHSLLDYFNTPPRLIFDNLTMLEDDFSEISGTLSSLPNRFLSITDLCERAFQSPTIFFEEKSFPNVHNLKNNEVNIEVFHRHIKASRLIAPFIYPNETIDEQENPLLGFLKKLQEYIPNKGQPFNAALYNTKAKSLKEARALVETLAENSIHIYERPGNLSSSFALVQERFAAISLSEFSSTKVLRRQKQRNYFSVTTEEVFVPVPGETVVHLHNGIGKFIGMEKKPNHLNIETDYLVLEYADKARLYVPSDQAYLISRYVGASEKAPDLHNLNGSKWKRSRDLSEKSLVLYAEKLLQLEAQRSTIPSFIYPPHGEEVIKFAENFPYEETPDQLKAIEQIYSDMMSDKLMDRLICGDAGFGKTEVIMRAAVKAVCDGHRQVIVMVPTTILANQHYETFSQRMAGLPINIAVLSRFSERKSMKKIFEDAAKGDIDILIGTHKLINKNLEFKNPGLLIIDEEQRFGVKVKDFLKERYPTVDCLTVSATPIPRTLYMSLSGARDLSLITMPPLDRLPVSTFILEHNEETLSASLRHELLRGGQAYVIHNRIESIFRLGNTIRTLVPEACIAVAHGQMSSDELASIFQKFKDQEINILVATALIENGIDIPNANTILVDQADKFGMADLYQMKGRVGRWNRKAYCYFLVSHLDRLSGPAAKRLEALNKQEYGGGMKIALHDLEIRGAGNILGTDQSGHISAIGFNLYCKLLKKTVAALKNNTSPLLFNDDVKIEFPYKSRIPDTYIDLASMRIEFYQKIGSAEDTEQLELIKEEMRDRFGPIPEEVLWLFALAQVRLFALQHNISSIKGTGNALYIQQCHGKTKQIKKTLPYSLSPTPELLISEVLESIEKTFPLKTPR